MRTFDRIIATSDLHGQKTKFLALLNEAAYEPDKDLLIVCGDLIDRGDENLATLAICMDLQKQGAIFLKGVSPTLCGFRTLRNFYEKKSYFSVL